MAGFPTGCPWGKFSDEWASIPTGSGLKLGMRADDVDGSEKTFVKHGEALADGKCVQFSDNAFTVIATAAVTDSVQGVQDQGGVTKTNGYYGWVTTYGPCTPLVAAGVAAKITLAASATSGQLAAGAAGNDGSRNVVACAASGGGGKTACFIR